MASASSSRCPLLRDEFCKGADGCVLRSPGKPLALGGLARPCPFGHRDPGEEVALPQTEQRRTSRGNGSKLIGASLGSDSCSNSLKGGVR